VHGKTSFTDTWGAPRAGGSHKGTDVLAARGTPVVANLGGTLEPRKGPVGGIAYYLHADDGNTYYGAHLDALTAPAGRIEAGQQIGVVGDTGDAKGGVTHLHFELKPGGGDPVNSFWTLDKWC
jgi:murein DD-endopeptidase MepM/ murein hydrolase activator NlpD